MNWKYVKPLKEKKSITEFENANNIIFPEDYKKCVSENNGGRPPKRVFDTIKTKEREVKSFLSFNKFDAENIWLVNEPVIEINGSQYVAFATDCSGNKICFTKVLLQIVFINHEDNIVEFIADDFVSFMSSLYDL